MTRNLKYRLVQARHKIRTALSERQKAIPRLAYSIVREPKNINRHMNRFMYDNALLKEARINFIPPVFIAMITDNCNLRCGSCLFLLQNKNNSIPSYINADDFDKVLKKYNRHNKAITIFIAGGEPLLHPELERILDICRSNSTADIKISTNGILIKEKIGIFSKVDYVNVSMDAYDRESFRNNRGGTEGQYDAILEGLDLLREKAVYFSLSFLLSGKNVSEAENMIKFAEKVRPNFISFHNVNPHGSGRFRPLMLQDRPTRHFLKKIMARKDYPFDIDMPVIFDTDSPVFKEARCIQPWYYFDFNPAGDISYCCHMLHDEAIGNVFKGYDKNSVRMVDFRKKIMEGNIPENCVYCQRRFMNGEFAKFDRRLAEWFITQPGGVNEAIRKEIL